MKEFYSKLVQNHPRLQKAMEMVKTERTENLDLSGEVDFARVQLAEVVAQTEKMLETKSGAEAMALYQLQMPHINSALERVARIAEKAAKIRVVSSEYLSLEQQEQVLREILNAASRIFSGSENAAKMEMFTREIEQISVFSKKDNRGNVTITL